MKIGTPRVEAREDVCRMACDVELKTGEVREIWFEVGEEYGEYLCADRADAFLIGLLSVAMREGEDIVCEAPVTEMLLYNIQNYLLPCVTEHAHKLYRPMITAATVEPVKNVWGGVGTAASCGIDSFHSIFHHLNSEFKSMNLTHICLNNVGAYNSAGDAGQVKQKDREKAKRLAEELGLKLILSESNFADAFPQNHLLTNTYSSMFAVFCLQRLWRVYYYSSGAEFSHFSLENNDLHDTAYYDLLLLDCFSLPNIKLYSEGAIKNRLEKVRYVSQFPLAAKYLHVCIRKETNCGKCEKCKKTILEFDAIGKLNDFSEAFDIDLYHRERDRYLGWMYVRKEIGNMYCCHIYEEIKDDPQLHEVIQKLERQEKECASLLGDRDLVIYGAGENGRILHALLKRAGYDRLIYWIDNNDGLLGMEKEGVTVVNYEQWKEIAKGLDLSKLVMMVSVIRQSKKVTQEVTSDFGGEIEIVGRENLVFDWLEDV